MIRRLLLVALLLAGPAAAAPDTAGLAFDQHPGATVPLDAPWTEADHTPTTLRAILGRRPAVLQLGYFACPALCGIERNDALAALAASGLRAGTDYDFVFVGIDARETPTAAAAARTEALDRDPLPGAPAGIHFLTGPPAAIDGIAAATGFRFRFDAALAQFLHPAGVVLLTPDGHVASYLLGLGMDGPTMRGAVLRAGQGAIARAAEPVLLLCFHFDPATGRYTLAVIKLVRLAAILTVLTLAAVLVALRRAERR